MADNDVYKKYEEEFLKLDKREYLFLGKQLALFKSAMLDCKFTHEEAFKLADRYADFIFQMGVADFIEARIDQWEDEEDSEDDVDPEGDIE